MVKKFDLHVIKGGREDSAKMAIRLEEKDRIHDIPKFPHKPFKETPIYTESEMSTISQEAFIAGMQAAKGESKEYVDKMIEMCSSLKPFDME